jgi:hypothetical protein
LNLSNAPRLVKLNLTSERSAGGRATTVRGDRDDGSDGDDGAR